MCIRDSFSTHFLFDLLNAVHDSGMIAVAHHFSDSGQRGIEHFAAQIHCDLAREYDFAAPLAADNVGRRNIEVICNGVDDKFRRDHLLLVRGDDVAQQMCIRDSYYRKYALQNPNQPPE